MIISGNAGGGKTVFTQQFETFAESKGVQMQRGANGAVFQVKGHTHQSNYDGSQEEGDERKQSVLLLWQGEDAGAPSARSAFLSVLSHPAHACCSPANTSMTTNDSNP